MAERAQQDLEQILALLTKLQTSINSARTALEQAPRGLSTWTRDAERLVSMQAEYNRLLTEANRLRGGTSGNVVHTPAGAPPSPRVAPVTDASIRAAADALDYSTKSDRSSKASAAALERKRRADERRAKIAEEAARKEQELARLRENIEKNVIYQNALSQARQRGFNSQDLRKVLDRGGGIEQLTFERMEGGKQRRFQPYVNTQTGSSTPGLSSQFRTFGSDILRDIGQFTKWSIAVAAVYTPLQKLGELIEVMIDNESRLADATIAANISFDRAGEIFDASATAANRAGESISGVIDAYAQAIRAAGRYEDQGKRSAQATKLLNDSLILSKLSALDQGTAIDTLSAALLQSDRELDQGQELLNKWVRVSQIANVSIDGLAVGVAVLGDAAETSGLSIDQLNGLIAVLSEQSISGSKEAANTAKALIGAYQSDKAEAALTKYGIALKNANGEVRDFLEVYQELSALREQGILSEAAVSEVALALGGGGVRRAKDASALINSTDRLNQIAAESAKITGEQTLAEDSLSKKLQTVETANTRLGNSFQSLAQTLGDDGGLLDLFKGMLNALTGITTAADDLFAVMGRSGPVLATFVTGILALNSLSSGTKAVQLARLGVQNQGLYGIGAQMDAGLLRTAGAGQFGKGILADVLQMNKRGAGILGGAAVIGAGVSNLQAGRNEQAIGNVVGGAIGAVIGSTLGGPVGLAAGAAIGSSIGDSIVTTMLTHNQELANYFAGVITDATNKAQSGGIPIAPTEVPTEELIRQMFQEIGGAGGEFFGELRAQIELYRSQIKAGGGITTTGEGAFANQDAAALELLRTRNPELYSQLQERYQRQTAAEGVLGPGASPAEVEANRRQIADLQRLSELERSRQLERVSTGELRPSQFGQISERLAGFPTAAKQEVDAFGQAFIDVSSDINNTADAYNALLELVVNGTDEQQAQINSYVSDIQKMQAAWDNWVPGEKPLELTIGPKTFKTREELGEFLSQTQNQAAQFTQSAILNARLQNLKLPSIVGSAAEATPASDVELIQRQAEKLQQQFYSDMSLTNEEIEHLRRNLEDFAILVERAGENHFDTITGIDQKFWDAAQKLLMEQGKLKDEKGLGFQKFDIPMAQLEQLAAQSLRIGQSWQQKFNYDFKPEDQIAIDQQGIVQPLHADFKILALLLEKIVDQNQKQLDGQYNIPEGATFWVPLTAAYYRNKGTEGGGISDMLNSLDLTENTSATDQNTAALREAAQAFRGDLGYSRVAEQTKKEAAVGYRGDRGYAPRKDDPSTVSFKDKYGNIKTPMMADNDGNQQAQKQALTFRDTGMMQLMAELRGIFNNLITSLTANSQYRNPAGPGAVGGGLGNANSFRGGTTGVNTSPTTKLDLKLSSNVNLVVDGRILAQTMQSYLASELLRTEQTTGSISRRYII